DSSGRPELGNFFQQVIVGIKEKGHARSKLVYLETSLQRRPYISLCIGQRKPYFLGGCRTSFADVITAHRNRVPLRNFCPAEGKNISDKSQGRFRRVDIGAAGDILFKDVILNGAL